jgi:hypothetical protein
MEPTLKLKRIYLRNLRLPTEAPRVGGRSAGNFRIYLKVHPQSTVTIEIRLRQGFVGHVCWKFFEALARSPPPIHRDHRPHHVTRRIAGQENGCPLNFLQLCPTSQCCRTNDRFLYLFAVGD